MQNNVKSYEEMGLKREELYTEKALPYWQQFEPLEFTEAMRGEIIEGLVKMVGYLQWIYDDEEISAMEVKRGDFRMTVREVCENILAGEDMIKSALDLSIEFIRELENRRKAEATAQSNTEADTEPSVPALAEKIIDQFADALANKITEKITNKNKDGAETSSKDSASTGTGGDNDD